MYVCVVVCDLMLYLLEVILLNVLLLGNLYAYAETAASCQQEAVTKSLRLCYVYWLIITKAKATAK